MDFLKAKIKNKETYVSLITKNNIDCVKNMVLECGYYGELSIGSYIEGSSSGFDSFYIIHKKEDVIIYDEVI